MESLETYSLLLRRSRTGNVIWLLRFSILIALLTVIIFFWNDLLCLSILLVSIFISLIKIVKWNLKKQI